MANISEYVERIKAASTGDEIRDPLVKALSAINTQGRDAETFNYKTSDYFAKRSELSTLIPLDRVPREKSTKLVTGGGIFAIIGDIDNFDWGEDEWLTP